MTRDSRTAPPDLDERMHAATDFDRNLVVIAGAGTGKTSLLVERILTAVGTGRLAIDRLGAITFTERAAGEMRQRLAEGLERLLIATQPGHEHDPAHEGDRAFVHLAGRFAVAPSEVAGRALSALRHLDRARVETIHTFCAGLLREHPLEAGVQPDFAVDPGEMQATVLDEVWERFVSRELGSDVARPELWNRVLAPRRSLERLRELGYALASFSIPEELLSSATASTIDRSETAELPMGSGVSRIDPDLLGDLTEAVRPFALEAREELLRRGYVTFDGLLVLARNLLRDHAEVRESLKRRFLMLLVDEFQDTDPLQYEIVLYLGEKEGLSAPAAYDAVLEPGRLFVVGDPKQSIYRFRGADYDAFQRAVSRILDGGGRLLRLTANFRSVPEVIAPVNALFSEPDSVCWKRSDRQPDYDAIAAVRPRAGDGPRVETWTVDAGPGALAADRREAEGKIVAEAILRMVETGAARYDQITILLRVFTQLSDYLRPLRELAIPFVVDGGREFLARPEVAHLLVILKALARPSDPAALLAYLRSPVGAVPDTELAKYAAAEGRWHWREDVGARGFPDLARAFRLLRKLDDATRSRPPDETVRRALEDSELLTLSAAAFEGPQRVANLTKLAAAAAELARDGRLSLIEVVEALESGRTSSVVSDSPLADEQTDAVRVMTIHKAKGLENDVVIVPDLAREDRKWYAAEKVEVHVVRAASGAPALAMKVDDVANPAWQRFVAEEIAHEEAQEVRVLYVGVTRARERLIVLAAPSRRTASWVEALASWGYEAGVEDGPVLFDGGVAHRRCKAGARTHRAAARRPDGAPEAVAAFDRARERARESSGSLRRPSDEETWREIREDSTARPVRPRGFTEESRLVGVAVHRLLERWNGRDSARLLEGIGPAARAAAAESGASADAVEREIRRIFEVFVGSKLHERLRDVEVLGKEIPIIERARDGATYRGTLDLLYRERDGAYVVADYKTDRETDPAKLRSIYGPQLAVYARAVQKALRSLFPPRVELWMLRTAERHVLHSLETPE